MTLRYRASPNGSDRGTDPVSRPQFQTPILPDSAHAPGFDEGYLSPTQSGGGFRELIGPIVKWKWLVLLCVVLGAAIAAWRASGRPVYYVGIATITMNDDQEKYFYSPSGMADPTLKYFQNYIIERSKTIAEVMNSVAVWQAVAAYMARSGTSDAARGNGRSGLSGASGQPRISPMAVPRASVHAGKKNSLITITTSSLQRDVALRSLEGYLAVFKDYYQEKKQGEARKALAWLKEKVAKAREDLSNSQAALQAFKKKHGVISKDVDTAINSRWASEWLDRLIPDDSNSTHDPDSSDSSTRSMGGPKISQPEDPRIATLQQKIAELQSKYGDMAQVYAPTYPPMVVLQKRIDLLKNMLAELGQHENNVSIATARQRRKRERKAQEEAWSEIAKLNAAGPEFRLLKMELETNEKFYEVLVTEYKKAEGRVAAVSEGFTVSSPPSVVKIQPTSRKKVVVGGIVGLFGGLVVALLLGSMDTRIRTAGDIERYFACKTLGAVPDFSAYRKSGPSNAQEKDAILELLAHDDPDAPIFDPIRNLHASIFLSSIGNSVRCLSVTSSLPGEGKTLIAVSLAAVMCLDKSKSVLIVDADLRRPRIHKVFGLTHPGSGLTTLVRKGSVDWSGMVHSSRLPGLYYMMSGPIPRDPVAALRSETLEEVIANLRDSFDVVIIDSPPLLGFPDAVIASVMADGTIVVAQEGLIRRELMSETLHSLTSTEGTHLLGVVLNKVRPSRKSWYGYYTGYSYRYGRHGKYA